MNTNLVAFQTIDKLEKEVKRLKKLNRNKNKIIRELKAQRLYANGKTGQDGRTYND